MSQPTPYTPTSDFSQQEANNAAGRSTVNTAALDAEFANIETTLDTTLANLALIQRDDGNLSDETVEVSTLTRDVLNLIGGFVNRGDWVTATAYAINDIVAVSGYLYLCVTAHTSAGSFGTDSAKWKQFGFKPSDGIAAAAAQASIDAHIADTDGAHQSTAIQHGATTVSAAITALESGKASLASPAFTDNPTAPTQSVGNVSTRIATTEFFANAIASLNFQPADADIPTIAGSQAEMEAGTETALRSMSPLRVKQAIAALPSGIGIGQTWQGVTRAIATNYTNSTGKSIVLKVFGAASTAGQYFTVTVGGLTMNYAAGVGQFSAYAAFTVLIPAGAVYSFNVVGGTFTSLDCAELR